MAKPKDEIELSFDAALAKIDHPGSKAFGLSWLPLPSWLIAQALAIVFSLVKGLAKSDASKALFKSVVLKIYTTIRDSYAGDGDFD